MSLREATLRGAAWSTLEKWGRQGVAFLVFLLLAWLLEPDELGLAALATVYIAFVELLVMQGFASTIVQCRELQPEHLDAVFWFSGATAGALALLSLLAANPIADFLGDPRATPLIRALAPTLVLAALSVVPTGLLMRRMHFRPLALRTLASTGAGGGVAVFLAFAGAGVWSLIALQLVSYVVALLCLWNATEWRPRLKFSAAHLRALLPMSAGLLGSSLIWFVTSRVDQAIVGGALGAAALGQYGLAGRVLQLLRDTLITPLTSVALPALSQVQQDDARLLRAYYRMSEWAAAIGFPTLVGMVLLAPAAVPLLFGAKWSASVSVLQILAATVFLHVAFIGTHPLTLARGKAGTFLWLSALHATTAVIAVWLATPWGLEGVSTALVASWVLNCAVALPTMRAVLGVRLRSLFAAWAGPATATVVMSAFVLGLGMLVGQWWHPGVWVCISALCGATIYGVALALLRPHLWAELRNGIAQRLRPRSGNIAGGSATEAPQA